MNENYNAWNLDKAVRYYSLTRNKPKDIYESEGVFFFPLMRKVQSLLDVGCGAGGTWKIIRSVNPKIKYTGVDVSPEMVKRARRLFKDADFQVTSGNKLSMPDNSFDAVISLGVIHHVPDYVSFIKECYRVSSRYCLLDLPRLVGRKHKFDIRNSYMVLKERFPGNKKVKTEDTKVPYVLADAASVFDFLSKDLKPERILAKGYYGKYHKSVTLPVEKVCFAVVCIEKSKKGKGKIIADLPGEILERLKTRKIKFNKPFERMLK